LKEWAHKGRLYLTNTKIIENYENNIAIIRDDQLRKD